MGCLARAGCLLLIVAGGVVAWLNRDAIGHRIGGPVGQRISGSVGEDAGRSTSRSAGGSPATDTPSDAWLPLSEAGATRTATALQKLSAPRGPVFVTLGGADIASYIFLQVAKQLPASSDSFAARVTDETVAIRATMDTKDLGESVLGVAGALLRGRQHVQMEGTLAVIAPGMAEFRVREVQVGSIALPTPVISQLIGSMVKKRPAGLDENALPVSIPPYIGDVRVAHGKITLYKNVQ